jgi:hypothetical protein
MRLHRLGRNDYPVHGRVGMLKQYLHRGSTFNNIGGNTVNLVADLGSAAPNRLVIAGMTSGNNSAVTSVVCNGVPLNPDISAANSYRAALYSGLVTVGDGALDTVVTFTSAPFQEKSVSVWTTLGLGSSLVKRTGAWVIASNDIVIDAGDFLFVIARNVTGFPDYTGSEIAPTGTRTVGIRTASADWALVAADAAFSIGSVGINQAVAATYG